MVISQEILRDFCGTINSIYGTDNTDITYKETLTRAINAYKFTKDIVFNNRTEWIGENTTSEEVSNFCKPIIENILMDIFETGMFPETKEIILKTLNNPSSLTKEDCKKFVDDYYHDLAGELGLSVDQLNGMIKLIAS